MGIKQASETLGLKTTTYVQQPENNLTNLLYGTESSNWVSMSRNCLPFFPPTTGPYLVVSNFSSPTMPSLIKIHCSKILPSTLLVSWMVSSLQVFWLKFSTPLPILHMCYMSYSSQYPWFVQSNSFRWGSQITVALTMQFSWSSCCCLSQIHNFLTMSENFLYNNVEDQAPCLHKTAAKTVIFVFHKEPLNVTKNRYCLVLQLTGHTSSPRGSFSRASHLLYLLRF
jgi:hypothetical protein